MTLINLSRTLELKSGGIFKKEVCDVFAGFDDNISPPKNYLVLCDAGTKHIAEGMSKNPFLLTTFDELLAKLESYDGIFAVGSGTVCDAAKFVSFQAKKPFMVYGTALSMNGYLSSNASIVGQSGLKESIKCHLPKALYFDLSILLEAPIELTKAGFGDAMSRGSAQNDCFLSSKLKGTPYSKDLFDFRISSERFLLENHDRLLLKDDEFILELLENTIFTGLSMHLFGSSFTASGGEHAMSHFAEKEFPSIRKFYHGLQISAFTCEMIKIQHQFKEERFFDLLEFDLAKIFQKLKIPHSFEDLGLTQEEFEKVKMGGRSIRERYGFLNLLPETL